MKLSQFNFDFSPELIAKQPAYERDESKLMVVHRDSGKIEHRIFKNIIKYFDNNDVFIFNNTKVFPARLYGKKEKKGSTIVVFLQRELKKEEKLWDALVDPARKIRIGNKIYFGDNAMLVAEVIDNIGSRGRSLRFLYDGPYDEFIASLRSMGEMPLPKYITRKVKRDDKTRYQTIFAKHEGAVATPAAGLHFSKVLLKRMEIKGIQFAEVTLHIGMGNFRDVEVEDLSKHKMDAEQINIEESVSERVNKAKENKNQICAVGTSVLRTVESSVSVEGTLKPFDGWTNKFIFPHYEFQVPTSLVTGFHMPQSTMLITAAAFGGYELMKEAYRVAVKEGYRFGDYGDAMLIL